MKKIGWKLLIPVILLLGILWYRLVFVTTQDAIASYHNQRDDAEMNVQIEMMKKAKMDKMLKELEELKTQEAVTEIAEFDNIQNVMNSLNAILITSDDYLLTFANPVLDEETGLYRREVSMTFYTSSLERADKIIREIYASPYRCVIGSMSLAASDSTGNGDGKNSLESDGNVVTLQMTYYEIDSDK